MSILKIKNEQGVYEDILTIRGKSAYQSYLDTTTDNPVLTEEEWSAVVDTSNLVTKYELNNKVKTDVPLNAKFTDTTYNNATTSISGLMSALDKIKLDGINIQLVNALPSNPDNNTIYLIKE